MNNIIIGSSVGTKKVTQLDGNKLRSFFTPKIQINGEMVYIKDDTTSGIKECTTRYEAKKEAIKAREQLKKA
jgi:hypothetical protein